MSPGNVKINEAAMQMKRCDLPPEAYMSNIGKDHTPFARRPGYNSSGQLIKVAVNQFQVTGIAHKDITQFDVSLSPQPNHSIVYRKVWESKEAQAKLAQQPYPFIYDNNKLAWSLNKTELKFQVDLGAERGKPGEDKNKFMCIVRPVATIRMEALRSYLTGKASWSESVLECMNFLDHLLRQGPSERMKAIKRSFFSLDAERQNLSKTVEAVRGIYSAIRMTDSINNGGFGLAVNVDVSNQAFFVGQKMEQVVRGYLVDVNPKWAFSDYSELRKLLAPVKNGNSWTMSAPFEALKRLRKLKFVTTHNREDNRVYSVDSFYFDPKFGAEGAHAKNVKFTRRLDDGTEKEVTVYDYYMERYKAKIMFWWLPLIKTSKGGFFPVETCMVERLNPYPFKLDGNQTAEMIKFAVKRPRERKAQIMSSVADLGWANDKYLQNFGLKISPQMLLVQGRLIKSPEVGFGGGKKASPGLTGRWNLQGYQFVKPNPVPLRAWGMVAINNCIDPPTLTKFANEFAKIYKSHGGCVERGAAVMGFTPGTSIGDQVAQIYNHVGTTNKMSPQIIFFVVREKATGLYEEVKKHADCKWAIPTQVLSDFKMRKMQGQYISNVCLKVNAKLGGQTSRIAGSPALGPFKTPTCMIGVDVSHAAPGSVQASVASMCLSMDKDMAIYNGAVQTNGYRLEMLTQENIQNMLGPMVRRWVQINRCSPGQVFYFRDGVAEGQFAQVLDQELSEIKRVFKEAAGAVPKVTVIIATKRHHIRFFPEKGDRNDNPNPGTLLEREVTHPFHYDFYLCSHSAIQGTARPVHYNVIHDEIGMKVDELQTLIYHQCYTYCRSTTPVSLHPAVYYAHLAGNRARHHERRVAPPPAPPSGNQGGGQGKSSKKDSRPTGPAPKLFALGEMGAREDCKTNLVNCMWYV